MENNGRHPKDYTPNAAVEFADRARERARDAANGRLTPRTIRVGSPTDLRFEGGRLVDGSGNTVNTRPLTHGKIHALLAADSITPEEATRLIYSTWDDPSVPDPMPRWVLAAIGFLLGFIVAEARISCFVSSSITSLCGGG